MYYAMIEHVRIKKIFICLTHLPVLRFVQELYQLLIELNQAIIILLD
jgi:hypothetical protein